MNRFLLQNDGNDDHTSILGLTICGLLSFGTQKSIANYDEAE